MIELLKNIWAIIKAFFTEWAPIYLKTDLGAIGAIATILGAIGIGIKLLKKR